MTDLREDSFYEISLTHRQILSVFVVLLGCVVAAFLSGVWIGQRGGDGRGPEVVMADGASEEAVDGTAELERLNFFQEEESEPQPAVRPGRGTTLADDLGDGAEEAAPRRAERATAANTGGEAEEAAPAPETGEGVVIQVFSSQDREQAERIVAELRGGGHEAYLSPVEVDGKTMFRVRIGPFAQRSRAERVAENVRRSFRLDTWITQNS